MAYFKATTAFDINTLSLNSLVTGLTDNRFFDNLNEVTGASNEQDLAAYEFIDGSVKKTAYFGGEGFTFGLDGAPTGGTVRAISLYTGQIGDLSAANFTLSRLATSTIDLFSAASTVSRTDDIALLTKALSGADRILLSDANDTMNGFAGDDEMFGFGGTDTLFGSGGNDVISGGDGDDTLIGGIGNDDLRGGAGIDTASYSDAALAVSVDLRITVAQATGGAGSDILTGIESLTGSKFNDTLDGNKAANVLIGGAGKDTLSGNEGADRLVGGLGQDKLTGGTAADQFVFDSSLAGTAPIFDTITDFSHTQGDRIVLDKSVFTGLTGAANTALADAAFFASATATAAQDASDRLIYNTSTGVLLYDRDGTGSAAAVQIALIGTTTHPALVAGDFLLIA